MIKGEYISNKMCFPRIAVTDDERENELRTDENFRQRFQPEHHHHKSVLEQLPIDMVKSFVISDELHLFHLGIMKRYYKFIDLHKKHETELMFKHIFIKIASDVDW